MKLFAEFLTESKKQYAFRIKLACECDKTRMAELKNALDKYKVSAMTEPKKTPIAKTHMDFPHLKNIEVTVIDVLTDYPANPVQIREMIRDMMGIDETHIMVTSPQSDEDAMPVPMQNDKEALLATDYPTEKKSNILADLKKVLDDHESRKYEFAAKSEADGKTTNDLPTGDKSPIGSKRTNVPKGRK